MRPPATAGRPGGRPQPGGVWPQVYSRYTKVLLPLPWSAGPPAGTKVLLPLPWSAGPPAGSWNVVVGEGRAHCAVRSSLAADARAPTPTVSAALGTSTRAPGNLNRGTQRRGRAGASGLAAAVRRAPAAAGARREDTSHGVHVRSGAAAEPARAHPGGQPRPAPRLGRGSQQPRRVGTYCHCPGRRQTGPPVGCAADSTRRSRPRCRGLGTTQAGPPTDGSVVRAPAAPHGVLFETTPPRGMEGTNKVHRAVSCLIGHLHAPRTGQGPARGARTPAAHKAHTEVCASGPHGALPRRSLTTRP